MSQVDILLVEDDEITALNLSMSLQKHGYNIAATSDNIQDAKNEINSNKPNLVIIDISLQDTNDGITLGREVRESSNLPFISLNLMDIL